MRDIFEKFSNHMVRIIIAAIILLAGTPGSCIAQKNAPKKGYNTVGLSITGSRYLNQTNVSNYQKADNPLIARNTNGYEVNLSFSRTTKNNLILEAALGYGQQGHDIDIVQNIENFDNAAPNSLKGAIYRDNIEVGIKYFAPRIAVGYKYSLNDHWALIGKIGIKRLHFLNGYRSATSAVVIYEVDNGGEFRAANFNRSLYFFGEDPDASKISKIYPFNTWLDSWDVYVGVQKDVKSFLIQGLTIGISGTRTFGKIATPSLTDNYTTNYHQTTYMQEYYYCKNLSIGIVLGVVF